ncbi:MAG: NADH-quinone oxidoreductase subunit A [Acidimicrobiia bacterium]|nr:NADH-quinone oxidoreductase subunit A [Acidimicrobiia bacterium]
MDLPAYLPIAIMFLLTVGFVIVALGLGYLASPKNPTPEKLAPYECGIVPESEAVQRFPVQFYLIAMLFVIFDVEIVFLFAWAVLFPELGWFGIAEIGIFTALVVVTLAYVWGRGALDWNVPLRARRVQHDFTPDTGQEAA